MLEPFESKEFLHMTPDQVRLVRKGFEQLAPIAEHAAALFYDNLFLADPRLRPMFKGSMQEQGRLLMQMLGAAVRLLDRPDELTPVLRQLGRRHAGYGVTTTHYVTVGSALMDTLELGLGETFDRPMREAWAAMYAMVSGTMIKASMEPATAR
jgi:hemoglobin-like flavoprotein